MNKTIEIIEESPYTYELKGIVQDSCENQGEKLGELKDCMFSSTRFFN